PPWFGEAALRNFPNGRQVRFPHFGHQTGGACVASLFQQFIEKASAQGLDASCASDTRRPPFAMELPSQFALR
ncbi:MAG: hypothetical protein JO041_12790, partial [Acidobacteria bacterium]|nr:hypothetical protein [Acidobacteriota bacterium]